MSLPQFRPRLLVAVLVTGAVLSGAALAQQDKATFEPTPGQAGKDVIWLPTHGTLVDVMLAMAKVTPDDYVIDLGSGDGRTVIAAAKLGARAHGIEYNPDLVKVSQRNAEKEGVAGKATFVEGDIFKSDFSDATVVTLFLLSDLNLRLRPTLLNMKPGTRVASNTFDMGDWEPDATGQAADCTGYCTAHFWIVPAKVDGTWKFPDGELHLEQKFQKISGTLKSGLVVANVTGKLIGDRIVFAAGEASFEGRVAGDTMQGTRTSSSGTANWTAARGG